MAFADVLRAEREAREAARLEFLRSCPPGSIYGRLAELPILIRSWPEGMVLRSPLSGITFVPYRMAAKDSWACIVVKPGEDTDNYPVGCHIDVSNDEVVRSERVVL